MMPNRMRWWRAEERMCMRERDWLDVLVPLIDQECGGITAVVAPPP